MKVDLIVASTSAAAHSAKQANQHDPIVHARRCEPERQGLVSAWRDPAANVTGTSTQFW